MTKVMLWLAIAWTPAGPIVGQFDELADCKVAVGYAKMQGYEVTPCFIDKREGGAK